ncbi:MAG: aldo/keto reductase [Calditrichia bacterium]|nr:aldo/keto reductase [Calditrichia bacterium]
MKYRRFGKTEWDVSEIGYGMWGMWGMGEWKNSDDEESLNSLQRALDLGCNFFDTAWIYGRGKSEKLLKELIQANPDTHLYSATKVPPKNFRWPSKREYSLEDCFPPDHIQKYVEKSLENIGVTSIDLIQLHTWEDLWLQADRWIKKLIELKEQGTVKAIGISLNRWEPWNGIKAVESGLIDAVQVIYNIFDQNPEDELFPACKKYDVAVIARVPFDEGTLTGTLTKDSTWLEGDWRNTYFVPENLISSVEHAEALRPLIPEGMTMAEMALRFIYKEPVVSTVIPGMRKLMHVEPNIATSDAGPLDQSLTVELKNHRWDREPTEWSQ